MAGFRFFRVPKHQQFDYKPRYWDPRKEELQERLKYLEELQEDGVDGMKARISGGLRRGGYMADNRFRQRQVMRSNLILIGVIIALLILCYLMLMVYLPQIEQMME